MKKIFVLFFVVLTVLPVFAWQDLYKQESQEVKDFYLLRTLSGTATADPIFPVSADQLLQLTESLNKDNFKENAKQIYDNLVNKLKNPMLLYRKGDFGFDFFLPVLLWQTYSYEDNLYYPYAERPNIAEIDVKIPMTEYFTGFFLGNITTSDHYSLPTDNIFTVFKSFQDSSRINLMIPSRAYGSAGIKGFNFSAGRDRISSGNGVSGNIGLGGNVYFDDFVKASLIKNNFSFDWSVATYDGATDTEITLSNLKKNTINHKFSWSFLDTFNLSVTEGALIYTDNVFTDPRIFNPFMMIHDLYSFRSGNTNNYLEFDASAFLDFGLELNFEFFLDQILASFESNDSGENANAWLINAKFSRETGPGILSVYGEFVKTSSFCYLKEFPGAYNTTSKILNTNVDLFFDLSQLYDNFDTVCMGYKYGSDVDAIACGASFLHRGQTLALDCLFLKKGTYGRFKNETQNITSKLKRDFVATKLLDINLTLSGEFHDSFDYVLSFGWNTIFNKNHEADVNVSKPVFRVGFVFDPLALIPRN